MYQFYGHHVLSGVDRTAKEDANGILFVLDGRTYLAAEDPGDGYRSMLAGILPSPESTVRNKFPPVDVIGRVHQGILSLVDATTGRDVLVLGTNYEDDYYPVCVMWFMPENMTHNQRSK